MVLGYDFIIFSLIILSTLIPLYFFRKKIFKRLYKPSDFELFFLEIKKYMRINHPLIFIDYTILKKASNEENPKTKQLLVIEDIISQFTTYSMKIKTQESVDRDLLWKTYEIDSNPIKDKLPKDWQRRKNVVWTRDKMKCKRCGMKLELNEADVFFINPIQDGGTYRFENLLTTCYDCKKILNSDDLGKTTKSLNITESLMNKILIK